MSLPIRIFVYWTDGSPAEVGGPPARGKEDRGGQLDTHNLKTTPAGPLAHVAWRIEAGKITCKVCIGRRWEPIQNMRGNGRPQSTLR